MRLSFVIKTKRDAVSQHMGIHYAAAN
jgi:hypothetical protein